MTDAEDFFSDAVSGPQRDRYGRPMLLPRGDDTRVAYTRASSFADYIADLSYLHTWRMRYLARGLSQRYDLALLASAETYTTGFERLPEMMKANSASGKRLDEIIERALDHVKIAEKADYGTAIHAFTEPGAVAPPERVAGAPKHPGFDPVADTESFWSVLREHGIRILGTEIFTANDKWRVAGTFDHLVYVPGVGIIIGDKKTSSEVHGQDFGIQLVSYADGEHYDPETDQRMTHEEYVAKLGYDPALINRDVGIIFWIKDGKTELLRLDLERGRRAADVAMFVRDEHRKGQGFTRMSKQVLASYDKIHEQILAQIGVADSLDRLTEIWQDHKLDWTAAHTQAANERKGVLGT